MDDKATEEQLERLVGRAVRNSEFRASLLEYPQETADEVGVKLSEEQIQFAQELDRKAIEDLAEQLKEVLQMNLAAPGW